MRGEPILAGAMVALALSGCGLIYESPPGRGGSSDGSPGADGPPGVDAVPDDWPDGGSEPCDGFIQNSDFSGPLANWSDYHVVLTRDPVRELMVVEVDEVPDADPIAGYRITDSLAFLPGATYEMSARIGCDEPAPMGNIELNLELQGATQSDDAVEVLIDFDCSRSQIIQAQYAIDSTGTVEGETIEAIEVSIDWTDIVDPETLWNDRVLVDDVCYRRAD